MHPWSATDKTFPGIHYQKRFHKVLPIEPFSFAILLVISFSCYGDNKLQYERCVLHNLDRTNHLYQSCQSDPLESINLQN